jgi:hypothetical protein
MPKHAHGKKGKQQGVKVAPAQTDDDFDDMLAEMCAADPVIPDATGVSVPAAATASTNTPSTSSSSSSSVPSAAPAMGNWDDAVMAACERGDTVQLRRWGRQGVRIVSARLLFDCVLNGVPLNVLRYVVTDLGADVNEADIDNRGATPLHAAAQNGHLVVLRCLLEEFGADVHQADDDGDLPLYCAAHFGHLSIIQCLLKFGADVNQATYAGQTPLMVASAGKHAEIVTWLVKAGANTQASMVDQQGIMRTAADASKVYDATAAQTAYLEAKTHCSNTGCSGAGIMKCTRCKQARYCGEPCQLVHWKAHKADCKRWSAELKADKGK